MTLAELAGALDMSSNLDGWYWTKQPKGFDLERLQRVIWHVRTNDWFDDFTALCIDDAGWFWYLRGSQTRSAQFQDSEVEVEGPFNAERAFGPMVVSRDDREIDLDGWRRARAQWIDEPGDE